MGGNPGEGTEVVTVTDDLVRRLLQDQYPELAQADIGRYYDAGDHFSVRLGEDFGMRLALSPELDPYLPRSFPLVTEAAVRWTFPVSIAVFVGQPTEDFPHHWDIVTWHTSSTAGVTPLRPEAAAPLARALREIHQPAPSDAPPSPFTGAPLSEESEEFASLLEQARPLRGPHGEQFDAPEAEEAWDQALQAPVDTPPVWTHGGISPLYVLSDGGRFAGLCNWFYFGAGDPAAEWAAASILLPTAALPDALEAYGGMSPDTAARAQGFHRLLLLRYLLSGNAFLERVAWTRVAERAEES